MDFALAPRCAIFATTRLTRTPGQATMNAQKKLSYAGDGDTVAENRKARHDYDILDTYEAGLELKGTEVKSLRLGKGGLVDAFAEVKDGQVWLHEMFIARYERAVTFAYIDERRVRRLLMNRTEIDRLTLKLTTPGLTLIPLRCYFKGGKAKVALALAKGRRQYDKRHAIAEREQAREMGRLKKTYDIR